MVVRDSLYSREKFIRNNWIKITLQRSKRIINVIYKLFFLNNFEHVLWKFTFTSEILNIFIS